MRKKVYKCAKYVVVRDHTPYIGNVCCYSYDINIIVLYLVVIYDFDVISFIFCGISCEIIFVKLDFSNTLKPKNEYYISHSIYFINLKKPLVFWEKSWTLQHYLSTTLVTMQFTQRYHLSFRMYVYEVWIESSDKVNLPGTTNFVSAV